MKIHEINGYYPEVLDFVNKKMEELEQKGGEIRDVFLVYSNMEGSDTAKRLYCVYNIVCGEKSGGYNQNNNPQRKNQNFFKNKPQQNNQGGGQRKAFTCRQCQSTNIEFKEGKYGKYAECQDCGNTVSLKS